MTRTEEIMRRHLDMTGQMILTANRTPIGIAIKNAAAEIDDKPRFTLNPHQELVKRDLLMLIRLGIQAAGYVDLTDAEIVEVLQEPPRLFGMVVRIDPSLSPDTIRFEHPDGRTDEVKL